MKSHKIRNTQEIYTGKGQNKENGDKTKFTEQRHCQSENENKLKTNKKEVKLICI